MHSVNIDDQLEQAIFAEKATKHFNDHPQSFTFAKDDPKAGELMAIRWNPYTVMIIRLHEDFDPQLYSVHQFIKTDLPKLQPRW